jgi:hypothetical protein
MYPTFFSFFPAVLAALTDLGTAALVRSNQPDYPPRFLIFQCVMFGLALILATRYRWLWVVAFVLLIGGVILGAASVGFCYIPTVAAAGWVMVIRMRTSTPSYLDANPQEGIIYTESELEAMRGRQDRRDESN